MGIELALALGLAAAGAGVSAYNTNKTLKKQDAAAAQGIRNQAKLQREADARTPRPSIEAKSVRHGPSPFFPGGTMFAAPIIRSFARNR